MSPETAADARHLDLLSASRHTRRSVGVSKICRSRCPRRCSGEGRHRDVAQRDAGRGWSCASRLRARGDTLTVAQKQLLEIAKALAMRPKVLILDEPTASLDRDATEMLFGRIRAVVKTGTSVIYITHRLAELRQIATGSRCCATAAFAGWRSWPT